MKKDIKTLLENLCCSNCKAEFDKDSIIIKRFEQELIVAQLFCHHCQKSYGIAFLGFPDGVVTKDPLEVQEGPDAIDYDDVIDAHRFIQNLDEHWQDYLPKQ